MSETAFASEATGPTHLRSAAAREGRSMKAPIACLSTRPCGHGGLHSRTEIGACGQVLAGAKQRWEREPPSRFRRPCNQEGEERQSQNWQSRKGQILPGGERPGLRTGQIV